MKRAAAILCISATLTSAASAAIRSEVQGGPIVGTWTWTAPNSCVEKHTYLPSGLVSGTSGSEYTEEKYSISAEPDANGFYKLTGLTLKDTGGPDCAGSSEDYSGKEWTAYIRFSKDGTKLLACSEPNIDTCWGPYTKSYE